MPPIAPSIVFLGLISSHSFLFPMKNPVKYANTSVPNDIKSTSQMIFPYPAKSSKYSDDGSTITYTNENTSANTECTSFPRDANKYTSATMETSIIAGSKNS